jgi:Ca2+-binding RTX toxin-like protein
VPVTVVGSNEDDEDGQQEPHTVPNPNEEDSGPCLGGAAADLLIGDPGGAEVSGQFNVAIVVDVTGSIGPDNIATLNAAVEDFAQQIIDRDIADKTVLRLVTFAVRDAQITTGLESGKTYTWDGTQFVAADGQTLANAIDAEVANPDGRTDFEPPLQDAANFFNDLNGGTGPAGDDVNRIFYLTDGHDNDGPGGSFDPDNVPDLYGATGLIVQEDLQIRVFGIDSFGGLSSGLDPDQLNLLDDGLPPQPGEALHEGQGPLVDQVEADIAVIGFDDLDTALTDELLDSLLNDVGADVISGGDRDDIIFGDVPNTDALALAEGIDLPLGSGFPVFQALEAGESPSSPDWGRGDTIVYLRDPANQSELIGAGRGEGDTIDGGAGNDVIFGQGGDDGLTGGPGADTFVYTLAADEDVDEILDFSTAEGDLLAFVNVSDSDASGTIGIEDVVDSFVDGGGAGAVDTLVLGSGTTIMITDVNGILTDLDSLEANSLINSAMA